MFLGELRVDALGEQQRGVTVRTINKLPGHLDDRLAMTQAASQAIADARNLYEAAHEPDTIPIDRDGMTRRQGERLPDSRGRQDFVNTLRGR
jgi:hypothetical protein